MIISGIEEEGRRVKAYWCRYAPRSGCFRAGVETGAAMLDYTGNEMTIPFATK